MLHVWNIYQHFSIERHGFPKKSMGIQQVIPGSSEKLLLFFQGGGACFNDVSSREAEAWLLED